jgi:hypothetical protein
MAYNSSYLLLRDRFLHSSSGSTLKEFDRMLELINQHMNKPDHPFRLPSKARYDSSTEITEDTISFFEKEDIIKSFTFCTCPHCDTINFREGWGNPEFYCGFCGKNMPFENKPSDEKSYTYTWHNHERKFKINVSTAANLSNKCAICGEFTGNKTEKCSECTAKGFDDFAGKHYEMMVKLSDYLLKQDYRVVHERYMIDVLALKADAEDSTWAEILGFEVKHSESDGNIAKALKQAEDKHRYCDKFYIVLPSCSEENLKKIKPTGCIIINGEGVKTLHEPETLTKKQELWSTFDFGRRQMLLQKYEIKGRTRAYQDPDLAFKLLLDKLGEEKFVKEIRSAIIWGVRPGEKINIYNEEYLGKNDNL